MKSEKLCEDIANLSPERACFLGFSRGKDSIAAWLQLRRYFKRIIPFHIASVPDIGFVNRSLDYYEKWFETPIERYIDGENMGGLANLIWQPPGAEAEIDALELWQFDRHEIVDDLRRRFKMPHGWAAWGINQSDSLDRRVYVTKYQGRIDNHRSFYPTWDWDRAKIMDTVIEAKIQMAPDYRMANRTMAGMPSPRHLYRMREMYPEDYAKILNMFPMIEAELARQVFRRRHFDGCSPSDAPTPG